MFEQVLAGLSDGVLVLDRSDLIVYANPAAADMLAGRGETMTGKRPLEVVRSVELAELVDAVRRTGQPQNRELKLLFPNEKILLGSANLVQIDGGQGISVLLRDISELKRLENLRQEFVANVSHELKTPLTAIKSYAETLSQGAVDDPANNRQFLARIEKNATDLAALIDDMLALSRLEARRGLAPFEKVYLAEEMERAIETLSARIKEKEIKIVRRSEPENCEVQGDPDHLYRALLNLLDNAVKYSPPGGAIELSCAGNEQELRVVVQDHGPGIPVEHQSRIFERFYRVDKARSRELGGTGLGLSIVKHIMEVHGGRVELESAAGRGARFTLVFPIGQNLTSL